MATHYGKPLRAFFTDSKYKKFKNSEAKLLELNKKKQNYSIYDVEISNHNFIHTFDTGESNANETLVICHGYGAGTGLFYRNVHDISALSSSRVISTDWLGMGLSSRPKFRKRTICNKDTIKENQEFFVESLEEWRVNMGLEKITLMGHSLGGYLSTLYALKYPENVQKLILASPAGIPKPEVVDANVKVVSDLPWALRTVLTLWEFNFTFQAIIRLAGPYGLKLVKNVVKRRFGNLIGDHEVEVMGEYVYHLSTAKPFSGEYAMNAFLEPVLHGRRGIYARYPLWDSMKDLQIPTAILFGDNDWMYHPDVHQLEQHNNKISIGIVPNAGHHIYFDNPTEFNNLISKILTKKL